MKDTIALGFIVALIGITSAVATAQDKPPVVAGISMIEVNHLPVDTVGVNALEPAGLYAAAGIQGY